MGRSITGSLRARRSLVDTSWSQIAEIPVRIPTLKMLLGILALFASVSGKTLLIIALHNVFEPTTLQIKIVSRRSISKYFSSKIVPQFLLFMTNCLSICSVATQGFAVNYLFLMQGRYLLSYSEYETLFHYFYRVNLEFYVEPFH